MKIHIPKIHTVAPFRPAGYAADVLAAGTVDGEWLQITPEAYRALLTKYAPAKSLAEAGECCKKAKPQTKSQPQVNAYFAQPPAVACKPCQKARTDSLTGRS